MKIVKRHYMEGDENSINKLYKLITDRDRNIDQYKWEWVDTWNGQGSIWLAFDEHRENEDQLIMQYSLIPTPLSVYGESFLAGKTENCMSHPEIRGKGLYFKHEQEFFEEAKKRFHIFFTTTGNVANGAPGKVRLKLGYRAFDSWATLFFLTDKKAVYNFDRSNLNAKTRNLIAHFLNFLLPIYFWVFVPKQFSTEMTIVSEDYAPLKDIDRLWERNKEFYGVTVERTFSYLDWRINKNPYFRHKYLIYKEDGVLNGYIIFYKYRETTVKVADIFAEKKNSKILKKLIKQLLVWARKNKTEKVVFTTSASNKELKRVFYTCGFLSFMNIRKVTRLKKKENLSQKRPFHVFISEPVLRRHPSASKACNWYMTELVFEGRKNY